MPSLVLLAPVSKLCKLPQHREINLLFEEGLFLLLKPLAQGVYWEPGGYCGMGCSAALFCILLFHPDLYRPLF